MKVFSKRNGNSKDAGGLALGGRSDSRKINGTARALPDSVATHAKARFAFDFSDVKVHTDADAAAKSRSLGARAFTIGKDVFFGPGEFRPETPTGQRVLAHELAHVVQQSRGGGKPAIDANSAMEQDAHHAALQYGNGSIRVEQSSGVGIAREPLLTTDVSKLSPEALESRAQSLSIWFSQHLVDDAAYATHLQAAVDVYLEMSARGGGPPYPLDTEGLKGKLIAQSPRSEFELKIRRDPRSEFKPVDKDGVVVGYIRKSGGYTEMRDVEGAFVWSDEIGLETPFLDPIDLIPFELVGSLVAKAAGIGVRTAAKAGLKILAKDAGKVIAEEGAKLGTKEVAQGTAKTGAKELAKVAEKATAADLTKTAAEDLTKTAGKAGAGDLAKTEVKALVEVFRKGSKFKSIGAVTLKRLRNVLGRAGVSPSGYKLVKVSAEASRALEKETGEVVWGWISRTGEGIVKSDAKGRPIINFTERALSSLQEAVKTFGHEARHLKDFAAGLTVSSEVQAEQAGEKLWLIVQESLGGK